MAFYDVTDPRNRILGFAETLNKAYKGVPQARLDIKEAAISTSDFPALFNEVTNIQVQEKYQLEEEQVWQKIARRVTLPNFLPQQMIDLGWDDAAMDNLLAENGGRKTIPGTLPVVPEGTEYPTAFKLYSSGEQIATRKNGARVPVNFETFINDQWNILAEIPGNLVRAAKRGEDAAVTVQLAAEDGSGLNTTNFNSAQGTLLKYGTNTDGTAALTRDTLKAALQQAQSFKAGPNKNRPVTFSKFAVVIPRALKVVADEIAALPTQITITDGNETYTTTFTYGENFEFVINDQLDLINETNGDTAWYVVPFAGEGTRTALALTFLERFELPELRVHNETGLLLGGGSLAPEMGSFRNDTWEMRIRHIYDGAALNEMLGAVGSTGTEDPKLP